MANNYMLKCQLFLFLSSLIGLHCHLTVHCVYRCITLGSPETSGGGGTVNLEVRDMTPFRHPFSAYGQRMQLHFSE